MRAEEMKGINRTWLALLALALIVAVAYYLLEVRQIAEKPEETAYVWDLGEGEGIAWIRVTAPLSGTVTVERREGEWWVTEPTSGMAQAEACDSAVYNIAHLFIRRTIEDPAEEELRSYGLVPPAYTIEVGVDDWTLTLEVGVRHPGGAYYVRRAGDSPGPVLMVSDYAVEEVLRLLQEPPLVEPTPGLPLIGPEPTEGP